MQLQSSVPPGFSFQHVLTVKLRKMKQFSDAREHQKFSSPKVLLLDGFVVTGGWYNSGWLKRSECVPTCTDHLLISLGLTRHSNFSSRRIIPSLPPMQMTAHMSPVCKLSRWSGNSPKPNHSSPTPVKIMKGQITAK